MGFKRRTKRLTTAGPVKITKPGEPDRVELALTLRELLKRENQTKRRPARRSDSTP